MRTHTPWRLVLAPLAWFYEAVVRLRLWCYDHGVFPVHPAPCHTVSVGGLEVGGSGKTPVTGEILRRLLAAGKQPGLLTRGYGRKEQGLVVRERGAPALPAAIGDEPAMLVASGLDVPVAAVARRPVGAAALFSRGCNALVLDDGFSHRALQRHTDIVVLRGEAPFGSGRVLPWGTLREPRRSLQRTHIVWLHYRNSEPPAEPPAWVAHAAPQATCILSRAVPDGPRTRAGEPVSLVGASVVTACGIAHPEDFECTARACGARVVELRRFSDHHTYTESDARALHALVKKSYARALLVTPKDAVKLSMLWPGSDDSLWVLGTAVRVTYNESTLRNSLESCDKP